MQVLTFDEGGVSGHPNHVACARGARRWLATAASGPDRSAVPDLYELATHPPWLKFLGPWAAVLLLLLNPSPADGTRWLLFPTSLRATWAAMAAHASQLVWFRYLFLHGAVYPYANLIRQREVAPDRPREGADGE